MKKIVSFRIIVLPVSVIQAFPRKLTVVATVARRCQCPLLAQCGSRSLRRDSSVIKSDSKQTKCQKVASDGKLAPPEDLCA